MTALLLSFSHDPMQKRQLSAGLASPDDPKELPDAQLPLQRLVSSVHNHRQLAVPEDARPPHCSPQLTPHALGKLHRPVLDCGVPVSTDTYPVALTGQVWQRVNTEKVGASPFFFAGSGLLVCWGGASTVSLSNGSVSSAWLAPGCSGCASASQRGSSPRAEETCDKCHHGRPLLADLHRVSTGSVTPVMQLLCAE